MECEVGTAGLQTLAVQTLFHHVTEGLTDKCLNLRHLLHIGIPDLPVHPSLLDTIVAAHLDIGTQTSIEDSALQRTFTATCQIICQDGSGKDILLVGISSKQTAIGYDGTPLSSLVFTDFVLDYRFLIGENLLHGDGELQGLTLIGGEVAIQQGENLVQIHLTIEEDEGVGGVVVLAVCLTELLIGQIGDALRITAGVVAIAVRGEQTLVHRLAHHITDIGIGTLHLVVHNALEERLAILAHLVTPTLLTEDFALGDSGRMQDSIHIDIDEVEEVLTVTAGNRVHRLVVKGHGVEESLQGTLEQFNERLLDRVLVTSAQDGVFQNVEDTSRVGGDGLKTDGESHIFVIALQPSELCASLGVFHLPQLTVHIRHLTHLTEDKVVLFNYILHRKIPPLFFVWVNSTKPYPKKQPEQVRFALIPAKYCSTTVLLLWLSGLYFFLP